MKLEVHQKPQWDSPPITIPDLEAAACNGLTDSVEFFATNYVRFGPEGLYLNVGGVIHVFSVDVKFVRILGANDTHPF